MRTGTIYGLLCPIKKEIVYVGQCATHLHKRLAVHKAPKAPFKRSPINQYTNALIASGLIEKLRIVVLRDGLDISTLDNAERIWIDRLKSEGCELLNIRKSGLGKKRVFDLTDHQIVPMAGLNETLPKEFLQSLRNLRRTRGGIGRASEITQIGHRRLWYIISTGRARMDEVEKMKAIIQPKSIAA